MRNLFPVILLLTITVVEVNAQSITPRIINASGGYGVIGSNEFEWSVGEMTMVSTFSNSSVILTQGLLQPDESAILSVNQDESLKQLLVYPNPATSVLNIRFTSSEGGKISCKISDMTGREVESKNFDMIQGETTAQLNISNLSSALYMLEVTVSSPSKENNKAIYKFYKLQ